jgi:hypothetical protein
VEIIKFNPEKAELLREKKPLSQEERQILVKIRDRKLLYVVSTYLVLLAIIAFGIFKMKSRLQDDEENKQLPIFLAVAPYVFGVLFIGLTSYFAHFYYKVVHPFVKDLKSGTKDVIHFQPEPYKTPFFDAFYVRTPSQKNAMMRIDKEMYQLIRPDATASLTLSTYGRFVFSLEIEGRRLNFTEKDARVDG